MIKTITATAGALALATTLTLTTAANANHNSYKKKYASCGWYAISVCSTSYTSAKRGANRYGGYVINTSSSKYPNFRGGYYCSVRGAFSKWKAKAVAKKMRHHGAHSAYVKNAC